MGCGLDSRLRCQAGSEALCRSLVLWSVRVVKLQRWVTGSLSISVRGLMVLLMPNWLRSPKNLNVCEQFFKLH